MVSYRKFFLGLLAGCYLSVPLYAQATAPAAAAAKPSAAAQAPAAASVKPEELLAAADRARGAAEEGISWEISVETNEKGQATKVQYQVKAKGSNALAEATEPARNRGETMLFNDRSLWFFKPGLKKPMSISARQKLMGQAANGDIASTNYFRDYVGTIVGEELVDGKPCWKLELKAKANNVTYDGIRYWITKADRLGVKAEFLTVGGDVFKTAEFTYGNQLSRKGQSYPFVSRMLITDARDASLKTSISYATPSLEAHADSLFNVNNLRR